MEDDLKKMEDVLNKQKQKNGRRPKKNKNGRRPKAQLKKSTLIGCDIIVD